MKFLIPLLFLIGNVYAQTVELVIPYSAGGPSDIFGRYIAKYLSKELGKSIVAINKPGAEGRIGISYIQQRPANTLIVGATGPFVFNKVQYNDLRYDYSEFEWVVPLITMPIAIGVGKHSTIQTVREFINAAKTKDFSCGVSSASSLFAAKYIKQSLNLERLIIVPYKGVGDILVAVMGNNTDCIIDAGFVNAHLDGRLRIIATADTDPDPVLGNVDLLKNYIKNYTQSNWWGIAWGKGHGSLHLRLALEDLRNNTEFLQAMQELHYRVVRSRTNAIQFLDAEYQRYENMRKSLQIPKENQ